MIVIFRKSNVTRFQLDPGKTYKFTVVDFACTFSRTVTKRLSHGSFLAVESNLIAKNSLNPSQTIMFFEFDANKSWQYVKSSFESFDSLSIKDLEYAHFGISTIFNEKIPLNDFVIKVEIREISQ